jgi:hypothetical protein
MVRHASIAPVALRHVAAWALALAVIPCRADNLLQVRDGKLRTPGGLSLKQPGSFDLRGIELNDWRSLAPSSSPYVRQLLQPMALHGLNTVGISLQGPAGAGAFFSADGRSADAASATAFKDLAFRTRDHSFALVVSLFSSDRQYWLASADAYREAVKTVVKLLPAKHSCILVMGDLFGQQTWDPGCPYPMQNAEALIQLCRDAKAAHTDALLAIPARAIDARAGNSTTKIAWLYVGQEAEDLRQVGKPKGSSRPTVIVPSSHFLCRGAVTGSFDEVLKTFMARTEADRLSVRQAPVATSAPAADENLRADEKAEGFVRLFDGHSFDGWTTLADGWEGWSIDRGTIKCAGIYGTWLRSVRRYRSFVLRLEFRIEANGNSGVFIHAPYDGRASRFGAEIQIFGVNREQPNNDTTGSIYGVVPPRKDASNPPGQWNAIEIACRGSRLTVRVNDQLVQDVDTSTEPLMKERLEEGCLGLQDHGNLAWFRNIRIKEYPDETPASRPSNPD